MAMNGSGAICVAPRLRAQYFGQSTGSLVAHGLVRIEYRVYQRRRLARRSAIADDNLSRLSSSGASAHAHGVVKSSHFGRRCGTPRSPRKRQQMRARSVALRP
jgi:hypothetical protein